MFSLLRKAYDGHATRDIAPPAKVEDGHSQQLSWSGRLTVVACVTGAIDRLRNPRRPTRPAGSTYESLNVQPKQNGKLPD